MHIKKYRIKNWRKLSYFSTVTRDNGNFKLSSFSIKTFSNRITKNKNFNYLEHAKDNYPLSNIMQRSLNNNKFFLTRSLAYYNIYRTEFANNIRRRSRAKMYTKIRRLYK